MRAILATNHGADKPGTEVVGYLRALVARGFEAELFYYRRKSFFYSNFREAWVRRMNARLVGEIRRKGVELLLVFRGGYIRPETVGRVRKLGARAACLFPDNPFSGLEADFISCYDLFLTKDPYFAGELRALGFGNVHYLPHGYDHELYEGAGAENGKHEAEVGFLGSYSPMRECFLDGLVQPPRRLSIWGGPEWKGAASAELRACYRGGPLWGEEKARAFRASLINLCPQHPGNNVAGVSERTFDIAGAGAFQLVSYRPALGKLFRLGEEVVPYRSREELKELICYYAEHPEEAALIARRARERALREHTCSRRLEVILGKLSLT